MTHWPLLADQIAPASDPLPLLCLSATRTREAEALRTWLGWPPSTAATEDTGLHLALTEERLELRLGDKQPATMKPLAVDFVAGKTGQRLRPDRPGLETLARAAGVRRAAHPTILDATAGLGRDSLLLARFGCQVLAMERHPVVAALLADGLQRARAHAALATTVARITLQVADATATTQSADTIVLDPMYPAQRKSAAASRELQYLRTLLGPGDNSRELLAWALAQARQRVVVKRPRQVPPIPGPRPTAQFQGRSTRFDLYASDRLG